MILSSADILRVLGGSEIIRLAARLKIVDEKPVLSGDEYLYVCISRFPGLDEFEATWTLWVEGDGEEELVIKEIARLLPSVKTRAGLITELTTTDFRSEHTQVAPTAPKPVKQIDGSMFEERFQELAESIQDQMLLVNSGQDGASGINGRDGVDGRDGKDLLATDADLFDLNDAEQGLQMERGQVLTWDGSRWTNLFVPQVLSSGGGGGSNSDGVAGGSGIGEAPNDGDSYLRRNKQWVDSFDVGLETVASKSLTYDNDGRLIGTTSEDVAKTMTYDGDGRLQVLVATKGSKTITKTFQYKPDGTLNQIIVS